MSETLSQFNAQIRNRVRERRNYHLRLAVIALTLLAWAAAGVVLTCTDTECVPDDALGRGADNSETCVSPTLKPVVTTVPAKPSCVRPLPRCGMASTALGKQGSHVSKSDRRSSRLQGGNPSTRPQPPAPAGSFFHALRVEESRDGEIPVGDGGLSRGDYHITEAYWTDGCEQGGVNWDYEIFVWSNHHCEQVMTWYWQRYCPKALAALNYEVLSRVHNGGPKGHLKQATRKYWLKIKTLMKEQ